MKSSLKAESNKSENVTPRVSSANLYRIETDRIKKILKETIYKLKLLVYLPDLIRNTCYILKQHLPPVQVEFIQQICGAYVKNSGIQLITKPAKQLAEIYDVLEKIRLMENPETELKDEQLDPFMGHVIDIILDSNPLVEMLRSYGTGNIAEDETLDEQTRNFIKSIEALQDIIDEKLNLTAKDEVQRDNELRAAYRTNKLLEKNNAELERLLEKQRNELTEEHNKKKEMMAALEEKIGIVKEKFKKEIFDITNESEKTVMKEVNASEARQAELSEEATEAVKRYETLLEDHLIDEKALRARKLKVEAQLANWIAKYDQDIGDKNAEMEDLQAQYDKEEEEMNALREKFDEQEDEYEVLMKERDEEERRIYEEKAYIFLTNRAARYIQRFWRAYRERKAARKKARKSKKRGGSAGKKGGSAGKKKGAGGKKSPKDKKTKREKEDKKKEKLTRDGPDPNSLLGGFTEGLMDDIQDKDAFAKKNVEVDLNA